MLSLDLRVVRINVPQEINYTYKDQDGTAISLSTYVSVNLEVKLQSQLYATVSGTILSPATNGQVQVAAYTFTTEGIWQIQFVAVDGGGKKLFGEPLQFRAAKNVEDAGLSELLKY